ncbi:ribosome recycling factor [Candidatus Wolfebacteria bacterium]|nr:ribosome recycling factor [Candidatus Wolfebacteria bacterium]
MNKNEFDGKISGILKFFKEQMSGIRSNRPSAKLVEDIQVDYFGQKLPVKQLGSISVIPPCEIQISIWDNQAVNSAAKAIESSGLNVAANIDGNLIRINLPLLSNERRQELIKLVREEAEEARIKIRHSRDEQNKKIGRQEEKSEISEDQKFRLKEDIQKAVDKANGEIEQILENKIKEINE